MNAKSLIFVIFFLINFTSSKNVDESEPLMFQNFLEWAGKYNKSFKIADLNKKFEVFVENTRAIEELNKIYKEETVFELNQFADMTSAEFKQKILMKSRTAPKHNAKKYLESEKLSDLPDSFDWRDHGAVTQVKDQGEVGTCWAFSTVQNVEGQFFLKGNKLTNLSVEQVVDCDGTKDPKTDNADCGVYGGWPYLAFQYIINAGGLVAESNYSYCSGTGACQPCEGIGYNKTACGPPIPYCLLKDSCQAKFNKSQLVPNLKVVDWKAISENETDIAEQLMNIGPLSVALNAEMLQFYHSGIFNPISCNPKNLDHADRKSVV